MYGIFCDHLITYVNHSMVDISQGQQSKALSQSGPFSVWGHTPTIVKYDFEEIRGLSAVK